VNFDPQLSTGTAVSVALLASLFWGSWAIILKYTVKLPVEIIFLVLLSAALIFIWGLGLVLDGSALLSSIRVMFARDPSRVLLTVLGGFIYAFSNILGIRVMQMVGLALAQPISSSINLILGTLVSCLIGGTPSNLSLWRITLAGLLLIAAIYFSFLAGRWRPDNQEEGQGKVTGKVFLFAIIAAMSGVIYSTSISYGLKSVTHPDGLAVMPYLCLFLSGAWIGALILCCYWISKRREWGLVKTLKPKLIILISLASWTHYSGNVLHAFATRQLSSVLSWPLGMTCGLWTQLWGLAYGEFKSAPRKAYWFLAASFLAYLAGAYIISNLS
jgi:glucose uptake protein GlcU